MRTSLLLVVFALAVAGCSGGDDTDTSAAAAATTTRAATTTTVPETTTTAAESTTTGPPETTTTAPTTTTIAPGPGALALTRVVFEPIVYVTVTNVGNGPIQLGTHWLCQRPAYVKLPDLTMEPGDTVAIGLGDEAPPDLVEYAAVVELGPVLGEITKDDGEMALYSNPFFDDSASILDYVEWGSTGHGRSAVAVAAGIWGEGAFIEVAEEATSLSSSGAIGAGEDDWFVDIGG